MRETVFNTARPYSAFIGEGVLSLLRGMAPRLIKGALAAVITDSGVPEAHVKAALSELSAAGKRTALLTLPAGEGGKTLAGMQTIYSFLYEMGATRADGIIALGGGVVGDMAGFAAATYLRGVDHINLPTTLIAQTDSAYGGKTGVDLAEGKNHIGAVYQPRAVICDTSLIKTLDKRQRVCGMGEVIKYGAIADALLLVEAASQGESIPGEDIIARCVDIKRSFVEADEHDNGARHVLNFGHTIGHAIEAASGYKTSHGQAVTYGMLAAVKLGESMGITAPTVFARLENAAQASGLDTDFMPLLPSALPLIARDKKSDGSHIDMILLEDIARPVRKKLTAEQIAALLTC